LDDLVEFCYRERVKILEREVMIEWVSGFWLLAWIYHEHNSS